MQRLNGFPEAFYSLFFAKKYMGSSHSKVEVQTIIGQSIPDRTILSMRCFKMGLPPILAKSFPGKRLDLKSSLYDNCVFRIVQLATTMNFARDLLPMLTIDGYIYKEGSSCSSLSIKEKIEVRFKLFSCFDSRKQFLKNGSWAIRDASMITFAFLSELTFLSHSKE